MQVLADSLNALPEKVANAVKEAVTPAKPPTPDPPPKNDEDNKGTSKETSKQTPGHQTPGKHYKGDGQPLTTQQKFVKWWSG